MSNNTSVKITSAENLRCSAIDLFAQMESAPNLKSEKILEMGLFGCLVNVFFISFEVKNHLLKKKNKYKTVL